jgi:hypothetical protein
MDIAGLVCASSTAIRLTTGARAQITAIDLGPHDLFQRRYPVHLRPRF